MLRRHAPATCILLLLTILPGLALAQYSTYEGSPTSSASDDPDAMTSFPTVEVLMEIGLALPQGDLAATADSTFQGFGQQAGYALGIRPRIFLSRSFALAPFLSYTQCGEGEAAFSTGQFLISTKIITYGIDVTYLKPGGRKSLRPLLAAGVAIARDKYREESIEDETYYKAGINVLTWLLTAGVRWHSWELSAVYQFNQFSTARFYATGAAEDYDWSTLVIRLGYALPRF